MKRMIMTACFIVALLLVLPGNAGGTPMPADPPARAVLVSADPSFENAEKTCIGCDPLSGWALQEYSYRTYLTSSSGDWSLAQTWNGGWTYTSARQTVDITECIGPAWIHVSSAITTTELAENGEVDICDVSLYNENMLWIATVVERSNLDAADEIVWASEWYEFDGLQNYGIINVLIVGLNSSENPTTCYWDEVSVRCEIEGTYPYKIYFPYIGGGQQ